MLFFYILEKRPAISPYCFPAKHQIVHQNLIYIWMKLDLTFQAYNEKSKIWKKQTVFSKRIFTIIVVCGLNCKSKFLRETQNRALSSHFDSLLTPKSNLPQLEVFSVSGLVSLTLRTHARFWNFRRKNANLIVLICCAAVN